MARWRAWASGAAGACALNLVHETARKTLPDAPHVDQMAMKAIGKPLARIGLRPSVGRLRKVALAGDLLSNSLYYTAIAGFTSASDDSPKAVWMRAWALGLVAGALTVVLPPQVGLGQQQSRNFPLTAALTVGWYVIGALTAASVYSALRGETRATART